LGLRHKQATVLAITFASLFSGQAGGYRQAHLFAQGLTPKQRAAVHCWFNRRTRQYEVPGENCFYRVLSRVSVSDFQRVIWQWQADRHGFLDGPVLALDGKTLRGSGTTHLVGAVNLQSGRTVGVERVADKSNEIPAGQTLLSRLELDGLTVLLDALHTQVQTARAIVQEGGGGYVMVVKGNQSGLLEQARTLLPEAVPPYGGDARTQQRSARAPGDCRAHRDAGSNGFSPCAATGPGGSRTPPQKREN
jgi:predicted transposase YbfD/YdcC